MDSTFNKLVENLSFQVVAGPCNQNIFDDITPKSVGTPVNVKVKFRHKDDVHRGVISVPKFENIKMSKNLRLINSDQTILSFDFLMDMKSSERPAKKSQKKVFQIFRPGICLGSKNNNDDDGYPYVPPIVENENTTFSATKVNLTNNGRCYGLKKDTVRQPLDTNRAQTMFLGKCKPGGCLDPPFGEERYAYEPILDNDDIVKYQSLDDVENYQVSSRSYNAQLRSRSPLIEKDKDVESKLFDELLITYPSIQNCNNDNQNILRTNNTIENRSIISADTCIQSYYKPPRSKETSISSNMEGQEIQKIIDNEMKIEPTNIIATNFKSPSRDSIYIQTGCPAEPVLPKMVNLSPIESGLTSFENNLQSDIQENVEHIKECLGDQNISKFETGAGQNQEENLLQTPDTFSLLKNSLEKSSITNNIRIHEDIKTSPEIIDSIQNKKNNIQNEAQTNKKQSIIVITPVRDLEETLTNDDDAEYLPDFYDENGTDRPPTEFSESYSDTQYFNQKNDMVDKSESQLLLTNLQQKSSILQVNVSNVPINKAILQNNQIFLYSFQKLEIKEDDTNNLKSNLASQSNITNISLGSNQVNNSSIVILEDRIRNVEDFKIKNDGEGSQKVYDLNMSPKISVTDDKESNLKENILSDKDVENRSTVREEAHGSVASVNNIGKSFKPNQQSIQNISLTSSRHSVPEIIYTARIAEEIR
ncbi:uncharacterized protein LOC125055561 [Pieris napi]|uniref:uncharacterized protein LOC125055561 n=1 Tax=Pieris napi TaxID=78633 RepID=UPI001FBB6416|nr:uncharacterized protein LOC125055561 [Pieris napi]